MEQQGFFGNRRKSRSPIRRVFAKFPQWTSLARAQKQKQEEEEPVFGPWQQAPPPPPPPPPPHFACEEGGVVFGPEPRPAPEKENLPVYGPHPRPTPETENLPVYGPHPRPTPEEEKRPVYGPQPRPDTEEDGPVFGPQPRLRPRSRSVDRAKYRLPIPGGAEPASASNERKKLSYAAAVQRCTDTTSGSSSGPLPLSSPTLSRVSSTISSDSLAELFPFDSEIFEPMTLKKELRKEGVVALRNPNTVAICQPPRIITGIHPRVPLGMPDINGSFGTYVQQKPSAPVLRKLLEKLKKMTGTEVKEAAPLLLQNKETAMPLQQKEEENKEENKVASKKADTPIPAKSSTAAANTADPVPVPAPFRPKQKVRAKAFKRKNMPFRRVPNITNNTQNIANIVDCSPLVVAARNMKFCCQLAHGSPTAIISNFASIEELFQSIADSFNISPDDIIFCTVNTFKRDMDKLFAGSLEYSDMLFAHVKGQAVEVELTKSEGVFGLTVSDNGRCRSFIKKIKDDSIASRAKPALDIGQLIEKIDGINVTGMRHYEVVRILRNMPIGKTFTLRVVSPKQSGFQLIAPRNSLSSKKTLNDGQRTLRFKANGGVVIEEGALDRVMIGRLNEVLDSYLGVQDDQMAQSLWDLALKCETLSEMNKAVRDSELSIFDFPDELVFDMWGIVSDWRRKCDKENKEKNQKVNLLDDDEEQPLLPLFS
ncbi:unnamed protein product [Cylicocyclus nassatus]|uniref:PDZ domain-containing protein n=1 Tax=Cylicocyclus nassatus TaxID=53992 RepID=A0AA36M3W4_CYLNA|nr:unnamed protein product [Cylicocyclus nassatus]